MLTTAPLCWLVAAHAIWGSTVLDKQNPQHPKQSRVCDWLSQESGCLAGGSLSCSGEGVCTHACAGAQLSVPLLPGVCGI